MYKTKKIMRKFYKKNKTNTNYFFFYISKTLKYAPPQYKTPKKHAVTEK
jgi:hypothetical protein